MSRVGDKDATYQILIRTHKLSVIIAKKVSSPIATIKEDLLSALNQFEEDESAAGVPRASPFSMILDAKLRVIYAYYQVTSTDEFELCRRNVSSDTYIVIDETERTIKEVGIKPWEKLFVRFRDATGDLMPVEVEFPPLLEDDE